jgi:hypothetical protein
MKTIQGYMDIGSKKARSPASVPQETAFPGAHDLRSIEANSVFQEDIQAGRVTKAAISIRDRLANATEYGLTGAFGE